MRKFTIMFAIIAMILATAPASAQQPGPQPTPVVIGTPERIVDPTTEDNSADMRRDAEGRKAQSHASDTLISVRWSPTRFNPQTGTTTHELSISTTNPRSGKLAVTLTKNGEVIPLEPTIPGSYFWEDYGPSEVTSVEVGFTNGTQKFLVLNWQPAICRIAPELHWVFAVSTGGMGDYYTLLTMDNNRRGQTLWSFIAFDSTPGKTGYFPIQVLDVDESSSYHSPNDTIELNSSYNTGFGYTCMRARWQNVGQMLGLRQPN